MARSNALIDALKRELRMRRITYARVAKHLGLSETSVKRMFSREDLSLSRIDRICDLAGIEFSDLARLLAARQTAISQLTHEQEREFVADHKLMLVALSVLNYWPVERILRSYNLSEAECTKLLARLDKLKFIELLPNNRVRPLVSKAFSWLPDGPIQRLFKEQVQRDFFHSNFSADNELMLLMNGTVSQASVTALLSRLKRVAAEFADTRAEDSALPASERTAITLVIAARPWEPAMLAKFRRQRKTGATRAHRMARR